MTVTFSSEEVRRYLRQMVLGPLGHEGQQAIKSAKVLVVGAGGLGSPLIAYLAAAGIGRLGIADPDTVAVSNLQRQIVYGVADVGRPKIQGAAHFAMRLNPHVEIVQHAARVDSVTAMDLVSDYDVVVDGCDNLPTRHAVAHAASVAGKPLVAGAVTMFDGTVASFSPNGTGLPGGFDQLWPSGFDERDVPSCETMGVLGAAAGVIGALMAMEVLKLVAKIGEPLFGKALLYSGLSANFTTLRLAGARP